MTDWSDPNESIRVFKGGFMDQRTVKSDRILKRYKGIHGTPNRSEFLKWGVGIDGPLNRSIF